MVKNQRIEEIKRELMNLNQNEENQRLIDFRERELRDMIDLYETGKDEGRKIGIAEARKEARKTIITNLLKMKMPIDKIIEVTNASKEEIEKIKKRNYNKEV